MGAWGQGSSPIPQASKGQKASFPWEGLPEARQQCSERSEVTPTLSIWGEGRVGTEEEGTKAQPISLHTAGLLQGMAAPCIHPHPLLWIELGSDLITCAQPPALHLIVA
jgi:hypothetical protein